MALTDFVDGVTTVSAAWLNEHFGEDGHVHDGQDDDGHAPKIDLKDHVDYDGDDDGTAHGQADVTNDDSTTHEVTHRHTGTGVARWVSGVIRAITHIEADVLRGRTGSAIDMQAQNGGDAEVNGGIFKATASLISNVVRARSGDVVSLFDDSGDIVAYLKTKGLELATSSDWLEVNDPDGDSDKGDGILDALNVVQAFGRISLDFDTSTASIDSGHNLGSASHQTGDSWEVQLTTSAGGTIFPVGVIYQESAPEPSSNPVVGVVTQGVSGGSLELSLQRSDGALLAPADTNVQIRIYLVVLQLPS